MIQKTGRKLLSFLLSIALVLSLMPGISMTAKADNDESSDQKTPLTFEAKDGEVIVTLKNAQDGTQYKLNDDDWQGYTSGSAITLTNKEDTVAFRGESTACAGGGGGYPIFRF